MKTRTTFTRTSPPHLISFPTLTKLSFLFTSFSLPFHFLFTSLKLNSLLFPFLSFPFLSYLILSYPILSYPILSYPILSYPILSYPILLFPFQSYLFNLFLVFPLHFFPAASSICSVVIHQLLQSLTYSYS